MGEVVKALEVRAAEGQLRVRSTRGWASVRSVGGNELLQKLPGSQDGAAKEKRRREKVRFNLISI